MEDNYLSREYIKVNKLYRELTLDKEKMQRMVDEGVVRCITTNRGMKYSKKDLDNYLKDLFKFYEMHYALSEFIKNDLKHKLNTKIKNSVEIFFKSLGYEIISHKALNKNKMNKFLKIEDYNDFNKNYVKFTDFSNNQIKTNDPERLAHYIRTKNVKLHKLALQYKYTYLKRSELYKLGPITKDAFVKKVELKKKMGLLKVEYFNQLLRDYSIKEFQLGSSNKYILKEDAEFLFNEQRKILKKYKEKYYNSKQVNELYESIGRKIPRFVHQLPKLHIPLIARIEVFKGNTFIYEKAMVDAHFDEATQSANLSEVIHNLGLSREEVFIKILNIKNVYYEDNYSNSFMLWLTHVKRKLAMMSGDELDIRYKVSKLCNLTGFINETTKIKELNQFSAKELKLIMESTNTIDKKVLSIFFRDANQMYKEKGLETIKWDFKFNNLLKNNKETLYTLEDYFELIDYSSLSSKHIKVICKKDAKSAEIYSSYWLYIILHLNNAFRKSDIIKFKSKYYNILMSNYYRRCFT